MATQIKEMEYKLKLHEDCMESIIQTLIAVSSKLLPTMEEVKTHMDRIEVILPTVQKLLTSCNASAASQPPESHSTLW